MLDASVDASEANVQLDREMPIRLRRQQVSLINHNYEIKKKYDLDGSKFRSLSELKPKAINQKIIKMLQISELPPVEPQKKESKLPEVIQPKKSIPPMNYPGLWPGKPAPKKPKKRRDMLLF